MTLQNFGLFHDPNMSSFKSISCPISIKIQTVKCMHKQK